MASGYHDDLVDLDSDFEPLGERKPRIYTFRNQLSKTVFTIGILCRKINRNGQGGTVFPCELVRN